MTRHQCRGECGLDKAECPHDDSCYQDDGLGVFYALQTVVVTILVVVALAYVLVRAFG